MKRILKLSSMLCLFLLINGCERRQLSDLSDLSDYAEIELKVNWKEYEEVPPAESTALIYQYDASGTNHLFRTVIISSADRCIVRLPVGDYAFIVHNDKPDEAQTYYMDQMDQFESVRARIITADAPAIDHPEAKESFIVSPEFLATDSKIRYSVTKTMVDETKSMRKTKNPTPVDLVQFEPKQLTRNVSFEIHIAKMQNMRKAECIATGGYRDIYLSSMLTSDVVNRKYIESFDATFYPSDLYNGYIYGKMVSFGGAEVTGLKPKNSPTNNRVMLHLFVTLKNKEKTVVYYPIDVTDEYNRQGKENLHIHIVIKDAVTLPDIEIEGGSGSGFNPDVGDWEDGEEQEVPVGK